MRVLITGAGGFLGRAFAAHHHAAGDHVYGLDNLSSPYARWPDELGRQYRMAIDAGRYLAETETNFDLAIHLAAPVGGRVKIEGDPLFNADSLRLDSIFFRWAVKHAKLAVYPSSSAVYGTRLQEHGALSLSENLFNPSDQDWDSPDEMYGFTKLAGEVLAWKAAGYGLSTLCLRPFSGYGEGQSLEYPVPSILTRVSRREDPLRVWGTGTQTRDFVHVSDIVGATAARIEKGVEGYVAMNIGSGEPVSFNELALMAAEIAGYAPRLENDASKPSGVEARYADTSLMRKFYYPTVTLKDGLARVLRSIDEDRSPQSPS